MITENSVSSEEITINAPAELVWEVIVDFPRYSEWNEFCPQADGEAVVGSPLRMMVDLGHGPQEQVEYITRVEPPRVIVWSMENKPGDPIHADRLQRLTPIDGNSCRYISIDNFSGEAVAAMMDLMGEPVERGFNLCAMNLKARAESLYHQAQEKK